ncbi:MAG: hypothetical protein ACHQ4J_02350 [Candidatus Binatia bacterium]
MVPNHWTAWVDLLAKLGQIVFGLVALLLAVYAAIIKRSEIFRTELQRKQFAEVAAIRGRLHQILFDLGYIPMIRDSMKVMSWNLDDLRKEDPDSWHQYQRYKTNSLDIFYKVSYSDYYLWPRWVDKQLITGLYLSMRPFVPFTLVSTSNRPEEDRQVYMNDLLKVIQDLDQALRKHA